MLGYLGWRSPLRTTALRALEDGIRGDPGPWERAGRSSSRSLEQTLADMPATRQERPFARAYLALPLAICTLASCWCLSGLITMIEPSRAMCVLTQRDVPLWLAGPTVIGGAVADLGLGLAILWRPWTRSAALAMIGLSGGYLLGSVNVAGIVVIADSIFTATAAILQPVSGYLLARHVGWPLHEGWVAWSLALYVVVCAFWLPVVWMQIRMRNLAIAARDASMPLPAAYHRLYRWWFAFGFPAFAAVIVIIWLMLTKPVA